MSRKPKPADMPINTFINYLLDRTGCDCAYLDNGDKVIASPDYSVKVVLPASMNAVHHSEISDILARLGFQPKEIENMRTDLIRYEARL